MRALLAFILWLPVTVHAQVRTSDTPLAASVGAGLGYVSKVGRTGPAIGAEVAARSIRGSVSLTFPSDETAGAVSVSAMVYPSGRIRPLAFAVGAEYDLISDSGRSVSLVGPVASLSYRLVHGPGGSVIPEAIVGMLVPAGYDSRQANVGLQVGATARVVLATRLAAGGARVYLAPAVSRSVNLDRTYDRAAVAVSIEAGITGDL